MSSILSYLAPAMVFLAAILGLIGPSRKANASGLGAITVFGWASAGLAAISLCAALYSVYSRQLELAAAHADQMRIRSVAYLEINDGLNHLTNVLRYAALMPYTTKPRIESGAPVDIPYAEYKRSQLAGSIDLRSKEALSVLENLYLTPVARLKAPYVPSYVPFGTDVVRPSVTLIAEESGKAVQMIETAVQKYAANAISVEVFESASAVLRSPFLEHLIVLRESWAKRSAMEDSDSPRSLNFRFLNSGISGGSKQDYLNLLNQMERLRKSLDETRQLVGDYAT